MIEYFKAGTTKFVGGTLLPKAYESRIDHERNGKFDLEFKYPLVDGKYKDFAKYTIFYADVPYMGRQAFYLSNIKKMRDHVLVYAKHIFFLNNKNVTKDIKTEVSGGVTGQLIMDEFANCLQIPHPFTFSSNITERHVFNQPGYSGAINPLADGKHSILGQWGGVLVMDNWDVKLQKRWGRDTEYLIAKRKNINDIEIDENNEDIVTRIFLTKEIEREEEFIDSFGETQTKTIKETLEAVVDSPLIDEYPQVFGEVRETDNDTITTQEELVEHGKRMFATQRMDLPQENFTFDVTDDVKDYEFTIDDTALVYYEDYDVYKRTTVLSYAYDPIQKKYIEVLFGDSKRKSLIEQAVEKATEDIDTGLKPSFDYIDKIIKDITEQIKDPTGGVIINRKDGNGNVMELLITDNKDLDKAMHVWRWNIQGLAHSSNGINGDFDVAITQDGKIAANFIAVGELNAALIKVGILKSLQGNTWIDMENGHFNLGNITNDERGFKIAIGDKTLDDNLLELRTNIESNDKKITQLDTSSGGITASVGSLEKKVDGNKTATDKRLGELAITDTEISNRVTKVVNSVDADIKAVNKTVGEVVVQSDRVDTRVTNLDTKVDGIKTTTDKKIGEVVVQANQIDARVTSTNTTVNGNKTATDKRIAELVLTDSQISSRVSSAVNTANSASSTASGASSKANSAYSLASQTANDMSFKVSKNDIVSSINLNAQGATINSNKINLVGAVRVLADISGNLGSVTAGTLNIGDNAFRVFSDGDMYAGKGGFKVPWNADGIYNSFKAKNSSEIGARWKQSDANYIYQGNSRIVFYQDGSQFQFFKEGQNNCFRLGNGGSGAVLKSLASKPQMQARTFYDNAYVEMAALKFYVPSSIQFKKNVVKSSSKLDLVMNTPIYDFDYKDDEDSPQIVKDFIEAREINKLDISNTERSAYAINMHADMNNSNRNKKSIGFITEESPDEILADLDEGETGICLTSTVGVLWKAVQELTAKVERLEGIIEKGNEGTLSI